MRFHWFENFSRRHSLEKFSEFVEALENCGYYSLLQTYNSVLYDPWIIAASIVQKTKKIKFMIALRSMSLSPEYCARSASAFDALMPNRIMLNILHGTKNSEEVYDGIVNSINEKSKIYSHTSHFLKLLIAHPLFLSSTAEIVISGPSQQTEEMSNVYGDYWAITYKDFKEKTLLKKNIFKNRVGKTRLLVLIDLKIADEDFFDKNINGDPNFLVGTEKFVFAELQRLKDMGVDDIMFANSSNPADERLTHNFVKKYHSIFDT